MNSTSVTVAPRTLRVKRALGHCIMHCARGHHFSVSRAVHDVGGEWCPECDAPAHTAGYGCAHCPATTQVSA